jgi:hypothetical protein
MGSPNVSVILPAKDVVRPLKLAIRSCLTKSNSFGLEILVLVNESDLRTIEAVKSFDSHSVRLIEVPQGFGLAQKLNRGLELSHSKYVARMDADDICLPWRFQLQRRIMEKNRADVMFSPAIVFGLQLRPLPILPQPFTSLDSHKMSLGLLFGNPAVHPTMLAKRGVLESAGGYRDAPAEDLDLWLRLAIMGSDLYRSSVPTLLYRYSRNSLSHSESERNAVKVSAGLASLRADLANDLLNKIGMASTGDETMEDLWKMLKPGWRTRLDILDLSLNH